MKILPYPKSADSDLPPEVRAQMELVDSLGELYWFGMCSRFRVESEVLILLELMGVNGKAAEA